MYVGVFMQTFSRSKVDPSTVKKLSSCSFRRIHENLSWMENFEFSCKSFGCRITWIIQYYVSAQNFSFMNWCGVFMMGLWASGLRSLRPLASTHSVPRLTTPSFSPHINSFKKNSKLEQNISWFRLSFVQFSCRKIWSFPFLIDFHSFLPKIARK